MLLLGILIGSSHSLLLLKLVGVIQLWYWFFATKVTNVRSCVFLKQIHCQTYNIENTRMSFSRPDLQTLSYEVITFSMGANKS